MSVTPDTVPVYLHPHAEANEPVTLHHGPIAIQGGNTGVGTLTLRWLPSTGLRLEADLNSMDAPQPGARVNADLAGSTAEVPFNSMSIGSGGSGPFARVGGSVSVFETGTGTGLMEIGFQVVNFHDFLTPAQKQVSAFGFPPHVAGLRYGGWSIRLTAKQKLAKLLDVMKVPMAIPPKLSHLAAFAATNGWQTACETLAEIRHGYVHSNKKRRQVVLSAPNLATFEAWQLSLWYQELALLYLLDHSGEYRNRLTAEWLGEVERVPWV